MNHESIQQTLEAHAKRRIKKRTTKMKMSGKGMKRFATLKRVSTHRTH